MLLLLWPGKHREIWLRNNVAVRNESLWVRCLGERRENAVVYLFSKVGIFCLDKTEL